jgi:signal peptidase I
MEPTLIGDPACGDQILVNKFIYHFQEPRRWDVVVFKYPLDSKRNFIKRLIGLPGEEVTIKNGNIYVNGKLARKPPRVQSALLYPIFVGREGKENYEKYWQTEGEGWTATDYGGFLKTTGTGWYVYNREISNEYSPGYDRFFLKRSRRPHTTGGGFTVGEVSLRFHAEAISPTGVVLAQIRKGSDRFYLSLAAGGDASASHLAWYQGEAMEPVQTCSLPVRLSPEQKYRIQMSNLDDMVEVEVDGQQVVHMECDRPCDQAQSSTYESGVQLGGRNGTFRFSEISLWRDIYYLGRRDLFEQASSWQVPSDHFFFLGDNPPQSNDSRDWKIFRMVLESGVCLEGDQQSSPALKGDFYYFTDMDGIARAIPGTQKRETISNIASPFVPRNYLSGRAFSVFWPPTRMKVIR